MSTSVEPVISKMIVHEVSREKDGDELKIYTRDQVNNTDNVGKKLTSDLIELFKNATLNIGEFALDGDPENQPTFEISLAEWNKNKKTFEDFTKSLTHFFRDIIVNKKLHNVKGGLLVFYTYTTEKRDWLAIAIVERTEGINTDKDLNLLLTQIIDLDKLHLGAAINLTDWSAGISKRYIRFKTGAASEVRDYFEQFIGCQRDKEAAIRETNGLREAITSFGTKTNLSESEVNEALNKASQFINNQINNGREIKLTSIANHIFPDSSNEFRQHAQEKSLSEDLAIDKKELRKFIRISGRAGGISISFDRELLGSKVQFINDKLTIEKKNLPEDLVKEIVKEQEARSGIPSED